MNGQPPAFHLGYQRALDGVRGMAITMVLLYHGHVVGPGFGFFGVNTFFVLSGFLITSLLVAEWDRTGHINLRHFYVRRALRLLPALAILLAVFAVYFVVTLPPEQLKPELRGCLATLFYFKNWAHVFGWRTGIFLGHTWSLSIEEQFYLLWPFLLLLLLRKQSRRSALCWVALGAFVSDAIRFFYSAGTDVANLNPDRLTAGLDTRADSLLLGSVAGLAMTSGLVPATLRSKNILPVAAIIALAGLFVLVTFDVLEPWIIAGGWTAASGFAMILILALVLAPGPLRWIFENPVLVYVGQISYGLYLWHYPIVVALQQRDWPWKNLFYLLLVPLPVLISYYLVERPCLRLKRFFTHAD